MDSRLLWLALGAFAGSVESSLIVSVLPSIAAETGVTLAQAGYLIFGYSVAYGIGTPVLGNIETNGDQDWYRVTLTAGTHYFINQLPDRDTSGIESHYEWGDGAGRHKSA